MSEEFKINEYRINEVFRHTDGKIYQCVEAENCEGCAFRCAGNNCGGPYCDGRSDSRSVKFILIKKPADGMLFRAENGRMYRLTEGEHWNPRCCCNTAPSVGCAELDLAVFGSVLSCGWYWKPVEEDAPAPVETLK